MTSSKLRVLPPPDDCWLEVATKRSWCFDCHGNIWPATPRVRTGNYVYCRPCANKLKLKPRESKRYKEFVANGEITSLTAREARLWPCPLCQAVPEQSCFTKDGEVMRGVHRVRRFRQQAQEATG